jgi:hypothetical protein
MRRVYEKRVSESHQNCGFLFSELNIYFSFIMSLLCWFYLYHGQIAEKVGVKQLINQPVIQRF